MITTSIFQFIPLSNLGYLDLLKQSKNIKDEGKRGNSKISVSSKKQPKARSLCQAAEGDLESVYGLDRWHSEDGLRGWTSRMDFEDANSGRDYTKLCSRLLKMSSAS